MLYAKKFQLRKLIIGNSIFIFCFFALHAQAQNRNKNHIPVSKIESIYTLPQISDDSLKLLEAENPNMFAYPFYVNIDVKKHATSWIQNDTVLYAMCFVSHNAFSLNLIFDVFKIPQGASLFLYNPDFSSCAGPFLSNSKSSILATPLIIGDTICILYKEPLRSINKGVLNIEQISHDYKNSNLVPSLLKAEAQSCNVNINCAEGNVWQNEKRAVCKLIINGNTICTGTLVNNTNQDETPYVLTANHCLNTQAYAEKTVFYFGYEYENCNETGSLNTQNYISGADLIATAPTSKIDFTLLQMSKVPPNSFRPYYAGWDASGGENEFSVCIHHPRGDAKKISIDDDSPTSDSYSNYFPLSHWKVSDWEVGTTESGSSGSAIFNENHQIIGTLTGGEADCIFPINDYFSKISWAWDYYSNQNNQIKTWLDPVNSGLLSCNGFDPLFLPPNMLTNIIAEDTLSVFDFDTSAQGVWTGTNEIGWNQFAEHFSWSINKTIYSISMIGVIDTLQNLSDVVIKVWDGNSNPENEIYQIELTKEMLQDSVWIHIVPETPIVTNGSFWVGYELKNNSHAFSCFMAKSRESLNTLFLKHPKTWINSHEIGCNSSLAILVKTTNEIDTLPTQILAEPPFFLSQFLYDSLSFSPIELFGIDSISSIYDTTLLTKVFSVKNVQDWSGVNQIQAHCFSNSYSISDPLYIRSLKLGIRNIPDTNCSTNLVVWNHDFSDILVQQKVSNSLLKEDYFNQIHFTQPLYITESFNAGICFDTLLYENNISLYQFYDSFVKIDGWFMYLDQWQKYKDYDLSYNVAVQPITCYSLYNFNKDSAKVLQYPISNSSEFEVGINDEYILFPIPSSENVTLRFLKTFYQKLTISIYNSQGIIISSKVYYNQSGVFEIPTNQLSQGLYVLKIETGDNVYYHKILQVRN